MGADPLIVAGAVLLGVCVGSFLNVCILRLPRDQSLLRPRSTCPHCKQPIAWRDNIPVFSWLWLRGKCRWCHAPISKQYPLIEALVGVLFGVSLLAYGMTLHAVAAALFGTILLGIAITDARHYIIPDEFTWGSRARCWVRSSSCRSHSRRSASCRSGYSSRSARWSRSFSAIRSSPGMGIFSKVTDVDG